MDNEIIYRKSILSKYPTVSDDYDFCRDGGWESFHITETVPRTVKNEDGEDVENLSVIQIDLYDPDVEWEFEDGSFYEDFGLGSQRCDSGSGYVITDSNISTEPSFLFDDDEVSREEFLKINGLTDDELSIITEGLEEVAKEDWESWAIDNLNPPEY